MKNTKTKLYTYVSLMTGEVIVRSNIKEALEYYQKEFPETTLKQVITDKQLRIRNHRGVKYEVKRWDFVWNWDEHKWVSKK